jgi:two-component system sensor histidine kinase ChvG
LATDIAKSDSASIERAVLSTLRQIDTDPSRSPAVPAAIPSTRQRPFASLRWRILAINILAFAVLAAGLLYLDEFRANLVEAKRAALFTQAEMIAGAIGDGAVTAEGDAVPAIALDQVELMLPRLVRPTRARARLFDGQGKMLADSQRLAAAARGVETQPLPPPEDNTFLIGPLIRAYDWLMLVTPGNLSLPRYRERVEQSAEDYPEVLEAISGARAAVDRLDDDGRLIMSVALPVQRFKRILGGLMLSADGRDIEAGVRDVRIAILQVVAVAFAVTVLLSLYLARTIVLPIRRLAAAADRVRRGFGHRVVIPDYGGRHDEIATLSRSLVAMTDSLYQRMEAIESFAADVAHEIKNPLTSLRSAVETLRRIDDPALSEKLMEIIHQDVGRLDRLISDIADASRLDAELSREAFVAVDLRALIGVLAEFVETTAQDNAPVLKVEFGDGAPIFVSGIEDRLGQVVRNLLSNAMSFGPPGSFILVSARGRGRVATLVVEDEGLGMPEEKREAIFERFYSARPEGEAFGNHSGLGLSISRQIIEAHGGTIHAENRYDRDRKIVGARFVVQLPRASDRA